MNPAMHAPVLIAFGSNIDPMRHLAQGLTRLHERLPVAAVSAVYRTLPVGNRADPPFLNGALRLHGTLAPPALKALLREIEEGQQRQRSADRNAPRTLDLDIAFMGGLQWAEEGGRIPDPDVLTRPFLAHALAELAPELVHPDTGETLDEIRRRLMADPTGMEIDSAATALLQLIPFGAAEIFAQAEVMASGPARV